MKKNKFNNYLKIHHESFTDVERFCLDALKDPNLIATDISVINKIDRISLSTLANALERTLRINQIDYIVIPREATKHKALIKILSLLHHLSIKVRFTPELSQEHASKLPLTLLRSMIL
ncbi:MAG: GTPase Era involved in 16S rRNA processing [Colwellia sp.]|jgi:GTPase Era involved in 16S rRNA processing